MRPSLARRLSLSADGLRTYAAFVAACELVAVRRNLSSAAIRRGLTVEETHKLILVTGVTHLRDEVSGRVKAIVDRGTAADPIEIARLRALAAARHEALYLAHTVFKCLQRPLARAAGISHAALRKALAGVEERREDPIVDRMLDEAELQLMGDVA